MSFTEEDLLKALGSRGGQVIGQTRSGKPIYSNANHATHSGFNSQDHYDAHTAHEHLAKLGQSTRSMRVSSNSHESQISSTGSSADALTHKNNMEQKVAHGKKIVESV